MSYEIPGFKPGSLKAGADLRTSRYLGVKLDANGDLVLAGDGDLNFAILQNKPNTGEECEIDCDGFSKAVAGAAFDEGDKLATDAAGKFITAASGKHVAAVAVTAPGGADELPVVKIVGAAGALLA